MYLFDGFIPPYPVSMYFGYCRVGGSRDITDTWRLYIGMNGVHCGWYDILAMVHTGVCLSYGFHFDSNIFTYARCSGDVSERLKSGINDVNLFWDGWRRWNLIGVYMDFIGMKIL